MIDSNKVPEENSISLENNVKVEKKTMLLSKIWSWARYSENIDLLGKKWVFAVVVRIHGKD